MLRTSPRSGSQQKPEEKRYPFPTIWINGRTVSVDRIASDQEAGRSSFEQDAFDFITAWLSGEDAFEQNTSGSTGTPKKVLITRGQMLASATRTAERLNLQDTSTSLICIDTRYIGGKMMLARSLFLGLQIMAVDPVANPLIRIPVDKCVQFTALVPYQISAILESKHPHLLNNLRHVLVGGAPMNTKMREELLHYQCACYETYGMTETVSHIALRLVNTHAKQSYFETLPGVEISLDPRGCLVINADYLPDPVITNDLVELAGPGRFLWLGRWDNVINTGGVKVMPEKVEKEIERIFAENKISHRFFIAGSPDDKLGTKIVLVLEGVQFSSELLNRSLASLKAAIAPFEYPKEVYTVHRFVMTGPQKINRRQTLADAEPLSVPL